MQILKSVYFFFLSNKNNFFNSLKKIYFSTNFYNKSLFTKIPKQFYFYPRPNLLFSFNREMNFHFKLSKLNTNEFWQEQKTERDDKIVNSFEWLYLINRKNDVLIIQRLISLWIYKNRKYKKKTWENSLISKRVISWILNADIILNNTNTTFKNSFFQSIISQTNHLKKNFSLNIGIVDKFKSTIVIILTGLIFKEYENNYENGIKDLKKLVDSFFDEDGFPFSRNSSDLAEISKYLVLIREAIKDAQKYVPDYLENILEKNINNLNYLLSPTNQLPLFNGTKETNLEKYIKYLKNFNYKIEKSDKLIGCIRVLKSKKNYLYFDVGPPPKKNFFETYQAGPLSFEYYFEKEKIITNCGFGSNISKKATLLSRLSSAHSTLTINDTSIVKFHNLNFLNRISSPIIKNRFKISENTIFEDDTYFKAKASHNAYEKEFGCFHKREISINKNNYTLSGIDEIVKSNNDKKVKFNIYFHLFPGVNAVRTMSGDNILIQIKKNKSLVFSAKGEKLLLEKSLFFGGNKILNNFCISIFGEFSEQTRLVKWEIKRET